MSFRLFAAALALVIAPMAVHAADEDAMENPYKNVKKGDYATYSMEISVAQISLKGTTTQEVIEKTEKEAKVKITAEVSGMQAPPQEQTIDLTKPYDPTKIGGSLPQGTKATVEKDKDGKEKVKVAGKEYETTWTSYKVKAEAQGMDIDAIVKVWTAKEVPMGMVKMEMTAKIAGMDMKMTMELTKSGTKSD